MPEFKLETIGKADLATIGAFWTELEKNAPHSFFQSWLWLGTWLESLPAKHYPSLAVLRSQETTLAAAFIGRAKERRNYLVFSDCIWLNESGSNAYDTLTPEYNSILAREPNADRHLADFLRHLCQAKWDEFAVNGVLAASILTDSHSLRSNNLMLRVINELEAMFVDLHQIRRSGSEYLETLSSNTRYQIRRAIRLYEQRGNLFLRQAESYGEAVAFFAKLKSLHQSYWNSKGQPGAFGTEFANAFHQKLIENGWMQGKVQLLRISAGEDDIGYLYNFLHDGRVYCYQSGFNFEADPKLKPGLVSHYKAIQHNQEQGYRIYDFLAGNDRYKRNLANVGTGLLWVVLQRKHLRFRAEGLARRIKQSLLSNGRKSS